MVGKGESLLAVGELLGAVGGNLFSGNLDAIFLSVATDSRNVTKDSLFVPLVGETQNGHSFIPQAVEKGASIVFVNKNEIEENPDLYASYAAKNPNVCYISVKNTLHALQNAAACYVKTFPSLIKIGITGSCGKTTTKEILLSILKQKYSVIANEGNLNSETGLPLSVFKIRKEHQVGIFEMGMNRKGEIAELSGVLFPNFAIITNIGTAHIGILGTTDAIAEEKKNIFLHFNKNCMGFIPADDKYADYLSKNVEGVIVRCGINCVDKNDHKLFTDVETCGLKGTSFTFKGERMILPLPGKHNFTNAINAIMLASYMGLTGSEIKLGLELLQPMFGRSQVVQINDVMFFLDCYNANPDSMQKALELCDETQLNEKYPNAKKIYVLGDMLELGEESISAHQKIGRRANDSTAKQIVCVGKEMKSAFDLIEKSKATYISDISDESINSLSDSLFKKIVSGDIVLLKGSRGIRLERIFEQIKSLLSEKSI